MNNKERVMKELQNVLNYSAESRPWDTEERGGGGGWEGGGLKKKNWGDFGPQFGLKIWR